MARIALKVDVDTLRGTREGVPALLAMLARVRAEATFLFSLGPDHTGWALRRVFRPGFLKKVSRTSVVSNYGLRTLMYGVLLPGPDIGRKGAAEMRAARAAGHECGIHTWDHVYWQDNVRERDAAWTRRQMQSAFDRYVEIFGEAPPTHGAAGWQMNDEAFRQIDDWGMVYASDGRGTGPYIPTVDGVACRHVQMPTTLPTLDELIGVGDLTEDNVHQAVLRLSEDGRDHVFTLHTELEGGKLAPVFNRLLDGWRAQGHELVSMATLYRHIDRRALPQLPVTWGAIEGRSGELILQP
ncbi:MULTISPECIES: polysaccharide deacetylase family protein [Cupriavidus]|uniref:polysaccharide deacetylase family protein n=1 Tax=Cupriavidus TaxID=106589 RepID=UPI001600B484|nr:MULTISPECIES: polysaccharide deacetylase family protein [Cupriavidus]MBB1636341.1 chitin deacetylase [Cupriavidus sp. UME77]MDR3378986.1 polysaccharide deacetylase family protein [Cupriavidus basilensis]